MENKLEVHKDKTLKETTEIAYSVSDCYQMTCFKLLHSLFTWIFELLHTAISVRTTALVAQLMDANCFLVIKWLILLLPLEIGQTTYINFPK